MTEPLSQGRQPRKSSGERNILTVGPYTVLTNLNDRDLQNPRLWTLRTPLSWARSVGTNE